MVDSEVAVDSEVVVRKDTGFGLKWNFSKKVNVTWSDHTLAFIWFGVTVKLACSLFRGRNRIMKKYEAVLRTKMECPGNFHRKERHVPQLFLSI